MSVWPPGQASLPKRNRKALDDGQERLNMKPIAMLLCGMTLFGRTLRLHIGGEECARVLLAFSPSNY